MVAIRRGQTADKDAIRRVHEASVRALLPTHYPPEVIEATVRDVSPGSYFSPSLKKEVLVAEEGGAVVGFGLLDPRLGWSERDRRPVDTGEIDVLYVAPTHVGKGVGRALVTRMEAGARYFNLRRLAVTATLNAEGFYTAMGFVRVGPTVVKVGGVTVECVRMEKELG